MRVNPYLGTVLLTASLLLVTSCKKESRDEIGHNCQSSNSEGQLSTSAKTTADEQLVKDVRNVTAKYHSTMQAIKAGYIPDNHCVAVPGVGGMGYHWAKPSLVDNVFDPLKPEVVLYATGPGGNLQLVAVEYVVLNTGQPAPMFGSEPFNVGGAPIPAPHWSLHVWLYKDNPTGMFKPFNPDVTCP